MEKTMNDKFIFIPSDGKQNYPIIYENNMLKSLNNINSQLTIQNSREVNVSYLCSMSHQIIFNSNCVTSNLIFRCFLSLIDILSFFSRVIEVPAKEKDGELW